MQKNRARMEKVPFQMPEGQNKILRLNEILLDSTDLAILRCMQENAA